MAHKSEITNPKSAIKGALKKDVILIFDIGEVDKRYVVFDSKLDIVHQDRIQFSNITDDEGDPAEDLSAVVSWIKIIVGDLVQHTHFDLVGINFASYGASWVHLDNAYNQVVPFYSFKKDFPLSLFNEFEQRHNPHRLHAIETGSPGVGLINSGFQLYWLKYHKPELYRKIHYSLHLPQFLSFIFTGVPLSDYTSLGCHTALWHYRKNRLHNWVVAEKLNRKLAPLISSGLSIRTDVQQNKIDVGVGMLDHAASLVPYLKLFSKPFILVNTGTWSISFNPFYEKELNIHDLAKGCLYYMRPDGKPVLAHKLFLGEEYKNQVTKLARTYKVKKKKIYKITYDRRLDKAIRKNGRRYFYFPQLDNDHALPEQLRFDNIAQAYHQLMAELVDYQISSIEKVRQNTPITTMIIQGDFAKNHLFVAMMNKRLKGMTIVINRRGLSAALGAAIMLRPDWGSKKRLKHQMSERSI